MIDTNGAVCSSALDGPGRVVAHQRKSCQFEPVASVLTTPLCTFVRGQVTGAVNHRIMRALYMEFAFGEPALVLDVLSHCLAPLHGSPP